MYEYYTASDFQFTFHPTFWQQFIHVKLIIPSSTLAMRYSFIAAHGQQGRCCGCIEVSLFKVVYNGYSLLLLNVFGRYEPG